jgi:hypothetical protein
MWRREVGVSLVTGVAGGMVATMVDALSVRLVHTPSGEPPR